MAVATGAVLFCPFHQTISLSPFPAAFVAQSSGKNYFRGTEPTSFHTGPNESRGQIRGAAAGGGDDDDDDTSLKP